MIVYSYGNTAKEAFETLSRILTERIVTFFESPEEAKEMFLDEGFESKDFAEMKCFKITIEENPSQINLPFGDSLRES